MRLGGGGGDFDSDVTYCLWMDGCVNVSGNCMRLFTAPIRERVYQEPSVKHIVYCVVDPICYLSFKLTTVNLKVLNSRVEFLTGNRFVMLR